MKKFFCLFLALVFTIMMTSVCFAEVNDPLQSTNLNTTTNKQYVEFEEDITPEGDPKDIEFEEEKVPKDLPKTGGIPAEAFYVLGGICIASAVIVSRGKAKTSSK